MKSFFKDHSYDMVKMFLNQFAISLFGFSLALATSSAENVTLRNITGVGAVLFYLFLIYTMTWDIGYRDRVGVQSGRKKYVPLKGALISLCANSVNFLLAIFIMLASVLDVPVLSTLGGIAHTGTVILEGMYTGLLMNYVGGVVLNSYWFVYFLLPIPAILVSGMAYLFGVKDVKFTSVFNQQEYPESDREPKRKKDRRDD